MQYIIRFTINKILKFKIQIIQEMQKKKSPSPINVGANLIIPRSHPIYLTETTFTLNRIFPIEVLSNAFRLKSKLGKMDVPNTKATKTFRENG